ncbi:MAG TPA: sulfatase [Lentisphaeria bacterium]|nr:MAG: sulfatase [Lentisphaerae bacterium GWF2_49_21]HBC89367.1 sulfatase [Lentisphaeria bacterium]
MGSGRKVVLIMTDTQRKDMLGCYGNKDMKTPNLDKLAEQGVRFEKAYCCQPVCGPARAALFTGIYPHSSGSWGNSMALGDNVKTIGQRFADNGIHCAYIGKWHLDGGDYFGVGRCPEGWDENYWYDMRSYLEELSEKDRVRSRLPKTNEEDLSEDFLYGHRVSDKAIDFIGKNTDEDFLLVVSYDEPHHPYLCPKRFIDMYKGYEFPKSPNIWDRLDDKPEHHKAWSGDACKGDKDSLKLDAYTYFLACNSYVDYEIGRVMEAIEKNAPDALVIYTTDHGDMMNSHSIGGKGAAMYEEITNVPLIVKCPEVASKGSASESLISHIDIVPTMMDFMDVEIPSILEGTTVLEAFEDPDVFINDEIFIEFGRYEVDHDGFGGFQPIRCCRDSRYKLVINLLASDELYDLEEDSYEMKNLINSEEHAKIRDGLHDKLLEWMNRTRDPFRGYYWERRPWRKDAKDASWSYTGMTRQRENEEYEPRQLDYSTGLEITEAQRKK